MGELVDSVCRQDTQSSSEGGDENCCDCCCSRMWRAEATETLVQLFGYVNRTVPMDTFSILTNVNIPGISSPSSEKYR